VIEKTVENTIRTVRKQTNEQKLNKVRKKYKCEEHAHIHKGVDLVL